MSPAGTRRTGSGTLKLGFRSIHAALRRAGSPLSKAAVGRIVRLCLKRKWTKPVVWLRGRAKPKRHRDFSDGHEVRAQRVEPVGLVYLWPETN